MLQIILGKSGYGKTEYIFNKVKELVNSGEGPILITPEQFSFVAERRLLKELGEANAHKVESLSFSSLNEEVKKQYGGSNLPILSKGSKAVMIQKAALSVKDDLILYSKNVQQASFITSFASIYDEMKSCRVTIDDIIDASNNANDLGKKILSDKLKDISTLISAYDSLIENNYLDSADELTRLYETLLTKDYFKGKTVLIDGFAGFAAQEYKIIEVILSQAKMTYITLCSVDKSSIYPDDLFYYVSKNFDILKGLADNANIEFLKPVYLTENHRACNDELKLLEENTYNRKQNSIDVICENIKLYSAKNIYDECDHTASQIVKLLRNGYKASDITVICRDLDKYEKELAFSFNKYNVPFFNDERQNIANQPIIMFVCFLLRIGIYSRRSEDIFALLKTGITELEPNAISELENYVYLWSINGSKWNQEFIGSTKGIVEEISDNDKAQIKELNTSREIISTNINKFISATKGKNCKAICKAIYNAIIDFGCDNGIRNLAEKLEEDCKSALAQEQGRVWDLLMQILDKLAIIGGDEEISFKDFYKLFNLMISNEDLGTIPTGLDNIQLGSADRIRCDNPRVVFILGANEGAFPQSISSHGIFTEEDRIALINNDFKLYSYGEILNAQEKYFAYMAMTSAKEKLYVSYLSESSASSIVSQIKASFPNVEVEKFNNELSLDRVESEDNAFEILASSYNENSIFIASLNEYFSKQNGFSSRLNAVESLTNNNEIEIKDKSIATKLFNKDMKLSASRIDTFYDCAFEYFCKFGLNARPRQKVEMNPMQSGTIIHYVLEQIIKSNGKAGLISKSDKEIEIEIRKHLNEYLESLMENSEEFTPRLKYQFMRLARVLNRVVLRIKEEQAHSDFEPKAFELEIGDGEDAVESKVIQLPDGGSISIRGAIDRVDTYVDGDTQYVRVVDYKTGSKTFNLNHILYGINLQMFIYLFTLCESNHELSGINAGVLYLRSGRNVFSYSSKVDKSSLNKDEDKEFQMLGIVLNDDDHPIAQHMESELEGKYIPVKTKKDAITGDIASLEEFGRISKKIDELIVDMGINLHNGKINQNPIQISNHRFPCEFCDYMEVCKNRIEIKPNVAENRTSSAALNMLKEDEANAWLDKCTKGCYFS